MGRLRSCWYGKVKNINLLRNVNNLLREDGLGDCKLQYAGALHIVCESSTREVAEICIKENEATLNQWFSSFGLWEVGSIPQERLTWLDIAGLPIEAWSKVTISNIASTFGRVLEVDEVLFDGGMTHSFGALVLTNSMEDINCTIQVKVMEKMMKAKIIEDHNRAVFFPKSNSVCSDEFSEQDGNEMLSGDDFSEQDEEFVDEIVPESNLAGEENTKRWSDIGNQESANIPKEAAQVPMGDDGSKRINLNLNIGLNSGPTKKLNDQVIGSQVSNSDSTNLGYNGGPELKSNTVDQNKGTNIEKGFVEKIKEASREPVTASKKKGKTWGWLQNLFKNFATSPKITPQIMYWGGCKICRKSFPTYHQKFI